MDITCFRAAMMAVDLQTVPAFKAGEPRTLFKGRKKYSGIEWDLSPDGKRFLMIMEPPSAPEPATAAPQKSNIVLNRLEELKQRVPAK